MNKISKALSLLTLPALLLAATTTLQAEQVQVKDEVMKCPMMEPDKNMTAEEKEKFLQQCKEHCKEMQEKRLQQTDSEKAPDDASVHQHKK